MMEPFDEEAYEIDDFPKNYTYKITEDVEAKMTIRIKEVTKEEEALEWLKKLNEVGLIIWRVQRTFPRAGKKAIANVFKQDMRCLHKTSHNSASKQKLKTNDCPATMTVVVKRTNIKYSRAAVKDQLLKDWPCIVKFVGKHNHQLYTNRHGEIPEQTRQQLFKYFLKGHSPTSAVQTLTYERLLQTPDDILMDKSTPSKSTCAYLYNALFKCNTDKSSYINLESLISKYTETRDGKAVLRTTSNGHRYLAFCSNIMMRAHRLVPQSSEIMFFDCFATGNKMCRYQLYVFYTVTPAGGLPLGIILTDANENDVFDDALTCLKNDCFPTEQFYSRGYPQVIMSNAKQQLPRQIVEKHFPKSRWLLCQRSVLRKTWCWTLDDSNEIDKHGRLNITRRVKELMYCLNEDSFVKTYHQITTNHLMNNYPKFQKYLDELCEKKREWASYCRAGLPLRRHHTFGYAEVNLQLLKTIATRKKMCFNVTQLFDFITTVYESYVRKILHNYSCGVSQPELFRRFLPVLSQITEDDITKLSTDDDVFLIKDGERVFSVNTLRFNCNCSRGLTAKMCKHLSSLLEQKMLGNISTDIINVAQTKKILYQVACGKHFSEGHHFTDVNVVPIQQLEVDILQPEMEYGYDHEELIQSEENVQEKNDSLSKENDVFLPALNTVVMLNSQPYTTKVENKDLQFTLFMPSD